MRHRAGGHGCASCSAPCIRCRPTPQCAQPVPAGVGALLIVPYVIKLNAGRRPNVHNLGLEEAGVRLTKGGAIDVDDLSCSSVSGCLLRVVVG